MTNGEAKKAGSSEPVTNLARAFVRQTTNAFKTHASTQIEAR